MNKDPEKYIERLRRRQQDYEKLVGENGLMKTWEDWYHLRHYENVVERTPEESMSYRHTDTTPTDYVRQLIAMMTVPDPVRTFWTDDPDSRKAQDICDRAEKYVAGVWQINRRRAVIDPYRAIVFQQIVKGRAYAYVWWDVRRERLYRQETGLPRDSYFPLVIEFLQPEICFPNPEQGIWAWTDDFIRAEKLSARRVAAMWGRERVLATVPGLREEDLESPDALYEYLDVWEFIDNGKDRPQLWNGIIYNGHWLIEPRQMKKYISLPFILIPAIDQPVKDIERRMVSPLDVVIPNSKLIERIFNRGVTAMTYQADPTVLRRMKNTDEFRKGPGQVIDLDVDNPIENVTYLQGIGISPQSLQFLQLAQGDLERASLARVSYGTAPASWSGYMANQAIAGSSLKNQPIADNLREGLSEIDRVILELTATHMGKEKISAYGTLRGHKYIVKVTGDELLGVKVSTSLTAKTPADEQAKASLAAMYRTPGASGMPLMSDNWIRQNVLGMEDATGAERDILRQMIMSSPTLMKYTIGEMLRASDWPAHVVQAVMQEMEGATGQGPGAPTAKGGPGPEAAQGEQPTAQPGPPGGAPPGQEAPERVIQAIQQAAASGQIPPEVANTAIQALQQGVPVTEVRRMIEQAMQQLARQQPSPAQEQQPLQPPVPPQAGMQGAPAAPQANPADELRQRIAEAVAAGQLPQPIGEIALQLLDQGYPPDQIVMLMEGLGRMAQAGFPPEAINDVINLVLQQGMTVSDALRAVIASQAEQAGGIGGPEPIG